MTNTNGGTGIEVTASHSILFIIYAILYSPVVEVDGVAHKAKWKSPTFIATSAGSHKVRIFYKLWWFLPAGKAETTLTVPDGGVARIGYTVPTWFPLAKGKIAVA